MSGSLIDNYHIVIPFHSTVRQLNVLQVLERILLDLLASNIDVIKDVLEHL